MRVALIIIGDEVLGAEVEDRNITPLLQWAAEQGHRAQSVQVVGDEIEEITTALGRARSDGAEAIITTGGVGITHDDRTVEAVGRSLGLGCTTESQEMIQLLTSWLGHEPEGVRRRSSQVPPGTQLHFPIMEDGRQGWPIFQVGDCYCLPGIPRLVAFLIPLLPKGPGPQPKAEVSFEGREADSAELLEEMLRRFPDLSAGSYPPTKRRNRRVRLVIKGTDATMIIAACEWLETGLKARGLDPERCGP
ncbi:MAG: hypothetical protein CMH55_02010 [Myxococcales bacterium]|nr:hypothetical protein [Myxococcales bacterium]|tara:strand:+ start:45 stop:788 length:744 start_codon:yes stop_codon:yes gene_type:complete